MNKEQLLLDGGWIDACIDLLKAYELSGVTEINLGVNPQAIWSCTQSLADLDLSGTGAALPIVEKLESIHTALQYLLDNPVGFMIDWGWTTTATGCWIFDRAFGKEEGDGKFQLSHETVELALKDLLATFSGGRLPWYPVLSRLFMQPVAHLVISDANKNLLVRSAEVMPLLVETLLLDSEHPRQNQDEQIRAAIQRDSCECFLQLALYPSGKEMLIKETAAVEALRTLAEGKAALTEEAQVSAHGALLAIGVIEREPEPAPDSSVDDAIRHVMLSCECARSAALLVALSCVAPIS